MTQSGADRAEIAGVQRHPRGARLHRDRAEPVADHVVQVARDPQSLLQRRLPARGCLLPLQRGRALTQRRHPVPLRASQRADQQHDQRHQQQGRQLVAALRIHRGGPDDARDQRRGDYAAGNHRPPQTRQVRGHGEQRHPAGVRRRRKHHQPVRRGCHHHDRRHHHRPDPPPSQR
jgi:hypothetical protein